MIRLMASWGHFWASKDQSHIARGVIVWRLLEKVDLCTRATYLEVGSSRRISTARARILEWITRDVDVESLAERAYITPVCTDARFVGINGMVLDVG